MLKTSLVYGLGAVVALGSVACSAAPPSEEVNKQTAAINGGPDFLWWNQNGQFSTWQLSGPTVTGTLTLDAPCTGCFPTWYPFATDGNRVWWFSQFGTGQVTSFTSDARGIVAPGRVLSWTCAYPSCSYVWGPFGVVHLLGQEGVIWYNQGANETSIWLLAADGATVTGAPTLSTRCGPTEGCTSKFSSYPIFTADFDGDGNSDILWWNKQSGWLTVWLLADTNGTVKSKQTLSWNVLGSAAWTPVGAADVNGDGFADILWQHYPDGTMSNWLLDGRGNVIGSPSLSWTCDENCTNAGWMPIGYVTF
jgi:hypothetical protein